MFYQSLMELYTKSYPHLPNDFWQYAAMVLVFLESTRLCTLTFDVVPINAFKARQNNSLFICVDLTAMRIHTCSYFHHHLKKVMVILAV